MKKPGLVPGFFLRSQTASIFLGSRIRGNHGTRGAVPANVIPANAGTQWTYALRGTSARSTTLSRRCARNRVQLTRRKEAKLTTSPRYSMTSS